MLFKSKDKREAKRQKLLIELLKKTIDLKGKDPLTVTQKENEELLLILRKSLKTFSFHYGKVRIGSFINYLSIRKKILQVKMKQLQLKKFLRNHIYRYSKDDKLTLLIILFSKYIILCDAIYITIRHRNLYPMFILYRSLIEAKWKLMYVMQANNESCTFFLDFHEYIYRNSSSINSDSKTSIEDVFKTLNDSLNEQFEQKYCSTINKPITFSTSWIYVMSRMNESKFIDNGKVNYPNKIAHIGKFLDQQGITINDFDRYEYSCNYTHIDYSTEYGYGEISDTDVEFIARQCHDILNDINELTQKISEKIYELNH